MPKIFSKLRSALRNKFIAGILTLIPIAITIYVLKLFINFFNSIVGPAIDLLTMQYLGVEIPGLGFITAIILIYLLGVFTTNFIGRKLFNLFEKWLSYIPLVRTIYNTSKKILSAFSLSKEGFEKVVFLEYPRKGIWSMGFVTGQTEGRDGTVFYNIFLPTTPNPTSGWMLFLPKDDVIPSNMSVDQGLKTLISAGSISAPQMSFYDSLKKK